MFVKELFEARQPGPDITYSFKEVKGKVQRVIAKLTGKKSEKYTKLIANYKEVDELLAKAAKLRNDTNAAVKEDMAELFDAEDIFLTRVIETVSATMTLAKTSGDTTKVDHEAVVLKLLEDATPELKKKIEELIELFSYTQKAKSPGLTYDYEGKPKGKVEEGVKDVVKVLKSKCVALLNKFRSWSAKYDKKLAKIKAALA